MSSIQDSGPVIQLYKKLNLLDSQIEKTIKEYSPGRNEYATIVALESIKNVLERQDSGFRRVFESMEPRPRPGDLEQVNEKIRVIRETLTKKITDLNNTLSRRPVDPG